MDDVFETEIEKKHTEMLADLDSISVDELKTKGLSISFGGKTFKFSDIEIVQDISIEEKVRKELKEKVNNQQQRIRDKINNKINQILMMHQQKQNELDRKEAKLRKQYSEAAMMPDINESHMIRGLSVVKGNANNELIWIYRGVYNPRFVVYHEDGNHGSTSKKRKAIPSRLVNRMKTDILILIRTKDKQILGVNTKQLVTRTRSNNLPEFSHYHQTGNGDCWGSWRWKSKWENPDDILLLAKNAEAVLETINHGSLANRTPSGLPRMTTIMNAVKDLDEVKATTVERENGNDENDDVWQSI